jgi:hypothetical protein
LDEARGAVEEGRDVAARAAHRASPVAESSAAARDTSSVVTDLAGAVRGDATSHSPAAASTSAPARIAARRR